MRYKKSIYIQWNIFVFNEKCFYFILFLYSPCFFIFLFSINMQWTVQWFQIRNLVCKLVRYPRYDHEIYMIWSCFCYKTRNNSIPGIQRFIWETQFSFCEIAVLPDSIGTTLWKVLFRLYFDSDVLWKLWPKFRFEKPDFRRKRECTIFNNAGYGRRWRMRNNLKVQCKM